MGKKTGIEWTDATWNPVTGCTPISAGCDHCYAKTLAERFQGTPGHYYEQGFNVVLRPDKLRAPLAWTKPRMVFVNSMSDLFHEQVDTDYIAQVYAIMALATRHTFQLLTKRPARMRSLLNRNDFRDAVLAAAPGSQWPLPNLWAGVSVEDQDSARRRIHHLFETPAAVRWLSMEPLLGPVVLEKAACIGSPRGHGLTATEVHAGGCCAAALKRIDWVVVGGESGRGARVMEPDWVRQLRDECTDAEIPFFLKQWGAWAPNGWLGIGELSNPERQRLVGPPVDEYGHREIVALGSAKANGATLDGLVWREYPKAKVVTEITGDARD